MSKMTIEQIADLAGVSRSTVSRVLNDHPSVSEKARKRVWDVVNEHGYAPSAAARSLASSRTNVIGLLIPRSAASIFSDPYFPQVIQGITETCTEHEYFLMLSMLTGDMEKRFYHRILRGNHFDGVIMLASTVDDPILPLLIKNGLPFVMIGRHPYFEEINCVDAQNRTGAHTAVSHLIELGHSRIATITGPLDVAAALDRRDGYKQALLEAGRTVDSDLIVEGDFTQEGGHTAMKQILALDPMPTAVFVASDAMALGALRAIDEAGLDVPDDMAVVGFDDVPAASFSNPPLTTVRQPIYELGTTAATELIAHLESDEETPIQKRLPVELIVRESCGGARRTAREAE